MRKLLLIITILFSFSASAQTPMYKLLGKHGCQVFGTDTIPAAIYSFYKVYTCYSGLNIKVRRASDNTTSDIGYYNNFCDTAALKTFIGSSDAYVERWYNQGLRGNVIDLIQTTTSQQPKIATAGSLLYSDGEMSILFDGSNDILVSDSSIKTGTYGTSTEPFTMFLVSKRSTTASFAVYMSNNASINVNGINNNYPTYSALAAYYANGTQKTTGIGTTNTNLNLSAGYFDTADFIASDGTSTSSFAWPYSAFFTNITLGGFKRGNGTLFAYTPGYASCVVAYKQDMRSFRTTIEASIKSLYGL